MSLILTSRNQQPSPQINQLPQEIVEHIFGYNEFWDQVALSRVCTLWRTVIGNSRLDFGKMHNQIKSEEQTLYSQITFRRQFTFTRRQNLNSFRFRPSTNITSPTITSGFSNIDQLNQLIRSSNWVPPKMNETPRIGFGVRQETDDEYTHRVDIEISDFLTRRKDFFQQNGTKSLFDHGQVLFRKGGLQLRPHNFQPSPVERSDIPDLSYNKLVSLIKNIPSPLTFKVDYSQLLKDMIKPAATTSEFHLQELILADNRPWIVRTAESIYHKVSSCFNKAATQYDSNL